MPQFLHALFHTVLGNYILVLGGAVGLGWWALHKQHQRPAWASPIVIGGWLVIAIPSILQVYFFHGMLRALERNTHLILHGQIWRPVTAIFVQGGHNSGLIFNLLFLYLLLAVAIKLLGWRRALASFGLGWLGGELAALSLVPVGAGNSVGNFGMAAGIIVALVLSSKHWQLRFAAVAVALVSISSFGWHDIHGFAFITALLVGLVWNWRQSQKVRY